MSFLTLISGQNERTELRYMNKNIKICASLWSLNVKSIKLSAFKSEIDNLVFETATCTWLFSQYFLQRVIQCYFEVSVNGGIRSLAICFSYLCARVLSELFCTISKPNFMFTIGIYLCLLLYIVCWYPVRHSSVTLTLQIVCKVSGYAGICILTCTCQLVLLIIQLSVHDSKWSIQFLYICKSVRVFYFVLFQSRPRN